MPLNILKKGRDRQKNFAVKFRKEGLSYSEIQNKIKVPKSTLSFWLKKIRLSKQQSQRLRQKRSEAARKGSQKKTLLTFKKIQEIKIASAKDIKIISKRELWLMGIILYWRARLSNGGKNDMRKGVHFTSTDPDLIKLFLKWLFDIGGLEKEEVGFDIFARKHRYNTKDKLTTYWSKITKFPKKSFKNIYFQKTKLRKRQRQTNKRSNYGFLRVRVRSSSMLARQISGWMNGIKNEFKLNS